MILFPSGPKHGMGSTPPDEANKSKDDAVMAVVPDSGTAPVSSKESPTTAPKACEGSNCNDACVSRNHIRKALAQAIACTDVWAFVERLTFDNTLVPCITFKASRPTLTTCSNISNDFDSKPSVGRIQ